jgi:hypothetical protein
VYARQAVSRVPCSSLSFKPHHKGVVKPPFTPPPSILPITPSQAPPLDGNQDRGITGHQWPLPWPPTSPLPFRYKSCAQAPASPFAPLKHPSSLVLASSTKRRRRRGEALCRRRLLPLSVLLSPFSFSRCTRRTTRTPPRHPVARSRGRNSPPRRAPVIPTAPRRRTTSTPPHCRHRAVGELRTVLLLLPVQSASQIVAPSSRTPFPVMLRRVFRSAPPRAGRAACPAVPGIPASLLLPTGRELRRRRHPREPPRPLPLPVTALHRAARRRH